MEIDKLMIKSLKTSGIQIEEKSILKLCVEQSTQDRLKIQRNNISRRF